MIGWQDKAQASHVAIALPEAVAANGRADDPAEIAHSLWYHDHLPHITRIRKGAVTDTKEGPVRLTRALTKRAFGS